MAAFRISTIPIAVTMFCQPLCLLYAVWFLFTISCSQGETTTLYVHPEDASSCPACNTLSDCTPPENASSWPVCNTLTDYANAVGEYFDPNITMISMVFLPGTHQLNANFEVNGIRSLTLNGSASGTTMIMCNSDTFFSFADIQTLSLVSLEFNRCGPLYSGAGIRTRSVHEMKVDNCSICNSEYATEFVSTSVTISNSKFLGNDYFLDFIASTVTLVDNRFENNAFGYNYIRQSSVMTTGSNTFVNNGDPCDELFEVTDSTIIFEGEVNFTNNVGSMFSGTNVTFVMQGEILFQNNTSACLYFGEMGGAINIFTLTLNFTGNVNFVNNTALGTETFGGAIYGQGATLNFHNNSNVTFTNNSAGQGGAVFLARNSYFNFHRNYSGIVCFQGNKASLFGGGIGFSTVLTARSGECDSPRFPYQECSFQIDETNNRSNPIMIFMNNTASEGDDIYGGNLQNTCEQNRDSTNNNAFVKRYIPVADVVVRTKRTVCLCANSPFNCKSLATEYVYPGNQLVVSVAAFDNNVSTKLIIPNRSLKGVYSNQTMSLIVNHTMNDVQETIYCTNIFYTITGPEETNQTLTLTSCQENQDVSPTNNVTITIMIVKCPRGYHFVQINGTKCECDSTIERKYEDIFCNTTVPVGMFKRSGTVWVGHPNDTYLNLNDNIYIYKYCPFEYCKLQETIIPLGESEKQCNFNRRGILCGRCAEYHSLLLGTSQCSKCSNEYLALLLFFATAGVLLIALLLVLNLTVATGMINGLAFYANTITFNTAIFFPSQSSNTYVEFLKAFLAWISLDFGIESCFYDGMDTYARTWLEFAFPIYIWMLIGLVFIVGRYSQRAAKLLGTNPVPTLATLVFLSYTKLLRTTIEAFSYADLDGIETTKTKRVWLYDGSILYLEGKHLVLFIVSMLVFLFFVIPYTMVLLTSQWLQMKSNWRILSWMNRPEVRSFLDAYHAPYKPRYRYWTGLLFLARFALLLTAVLSTSRNPTVNILVIIILMLVAESWISFSGGIYNKWYNDILQTFFFLNLGCLAATSAYVKFEGIEDQLEGQDSQESLEDIHKKVSHITTVFVTTAFIVFIGIVLFHAYTQIRKIGAWDVPTRKHTKEPRTMSFQSPKVRTDTQTSDSEFTTSMVTLREPLLDDDTV